MKSKMPILAGLLFFTFSLNALSATVFVQCGLDKPVHKGKLDFNMDIKTWQPVGVCASHGSREYFIPSFKLTFNGLTYTNKPNQKAWIQFRDDQCNSPGKLSFESFEQRINKGNLVQFIAGQDGQLDSLDLIYAYGSPMEHRYTVLQRCTITVK